MPQFDTGTPWDQGLNALSGALFRDPDSIARAGLYGAQQRNAKLEGDLKQRQLGGQTAFSNILNNMAAPPGAASPGPAAAVAPPPGPTAPPGPAAPPPVNPLPSADNPVGLAGMFNNAAPTGATGPTNTGTAGGPAPTDLMTTMIQSGINPGGGGGRIQAAPAAGDGSQKPAFDIGPAMAALTQAYPEGGPAFQAGLGAFLSKAVATGNMAQPLRIVSCSNSTRTKRARRCGSR